MTMITDTTIELPEVILDGTRELAADLEAVDADKGTVLMRGAPYNHEVKLVDRVFESFTTGAFAAATQAPHRVKLFHNHSNAGGRLIGHAVAVEDRADGVWIESRFSKTAAGQEARELARDGSLDQVSIEFRAMPGWIESDRRSDGLHVRHSRVHLKGVALVPHGAYAEEAYVASVRDADSEKAAEALQRAREAAIEHLRSLDG